MAESISELASQSGVSLDMAKKGLGALLAFLKDKLPPEVFSKIQAALPGADASAAPAGEAHHGVLDAVKGLAGKLFGGGGAAAVLAKLSEAGFSADQIKSFLPRVIAFLKARLPGDVMAKVAHLLPAEEQPVG
jgi:hypothetical protein